MTKYILSITLMATLFLSCGSSGEYINPFPEISYTSLDGKDFDLSKYKGKTVVLNYWATWCRPCIMEMPSMDKAYQTLKEEGFEFVAASYEEVPLITSFKSKVPFTFDFVKVNNNYQAMNISSIPTTYIINKEGQLAMTFTGMREWDTPEALEELRELAKVTTEEE